MIFLDFYREIWVCPDCWHFLVRQSDNEMRNFLTIENSDVEMSGGNYYHFLIPGCLGFIPTISCLARQRRLLISTVNFTWLLMLNWNIFGQKLNVEKEKCWPPCSLDGLCVWWQRSMRKSLSGFWFLIQKLVIFLIEDDSWHQPN